MSKKTTKLTPEEMIRQHFSCYFKSSIAIDNLEILLNKYATQQTAELERAKKNFEGHLIWQSDRIILLESQLSAKEEELSNCIKTVKAVSNSKDNLQSEIEALKKERDDENLLDWLQEIMTNDDNYCEVFFSGLRDFKTGKATSFQIECNPEIFTTLNAPTIREAIKLAIKSIKK